MGVEQVSSCRENFLVSAKKMQNLVCAEWKCSSAEQLVCTKKSLGLEQGKCTRCQASVKFSRCWVNP